MECWEGPEFRSCRVSFAAVLSGKSVHGSIKAIQQPNRVVRRDSRSNGPQSVDQPIDGVNGGSLHHAVSLFFLQRRLS